MEISKNKISVPLLKSELVGKKISFSIERDKGFFGKTVENWVRESKAGKACNWAHKTAQAPDCENIEVKMVFLMKRKRKTGMGLYRVKEDTAITQVSPADLLLPFESSHLYSKLNILFVFCANVDNFFTVIDVVQENFQNNPEFKIDYENTQEAYYQGEKLLPPGQSELWIIDGLGAKTGAYGKNIKTKTKGPKKSKGNPRSRAFYMRSSFINKFVLNHFHDSFVV